MGSSQSRLDLFKEYMAAVEKKKGPLDYGEMAAFRQDGRYYAEFEKLIEMGNALANLPKGLECKIKEIILKKIINV